MESIAATTIARNEMFEKTYISHRSKARKSHKTNILAIIHIYFYCHFVVLVPFLPSSSFSLIFLFFLDIVDRTFGCFHFKIILYHACWLLRFLCDCVHKRCGDAILCEFKFICTHTHTPISNNVIANFPNNAWMLNLFNFIEFRAHAIYLK